MNDILNLTNNLIAVPSTADNPQALKQVLKVADRELPGLAKKDFLQNGKPSVLYSNKPNATSFKIILNAHLDVVPGKPEQYRPIIKGGKLWGRGACDMKSGAAAEILAFKEVAGKVNYPLGLQLVTDEEIGGTDCTYYQIQQGIRGEFVIAGESTDLQICHASKGVFWLKITATGSPAHAAYLWNGQNAIWLMKDFLDRLQKAYPVPQKEAWVTTINLATIETPNLTCNKVPDACSIKLDMRYIPEETAVFEKMLKKLIPPGFTVEIIEKEPAQITPPNNPFLKKLARCISEDIHRPASLIAKPGASDIRHYQKVNVSGIQFGPIGDGLHSNKEWGDIASFKQYYRILTKFLLSL